MPGLRYYFEVSVITGNPKVGVGRSTAKIDQVKGIQKMYRHFLTVQMDGQFTVESLDIRAIALEQNTGKT
jgi:hypothetical protein